MTASSLTHSEAIRRLAASAGRQRSTGLSAAALADGACPVPMGRSVTAETASDAVAWTYASWPDPGAELTDERLRELRLNQARAQRLEDTTPGCTAAAAGDARAARRQRSTRRVDWSAEELAGEAAHAAADERGQVEALEEALAILAQLPPEIRTILAWQRGEAEASEWMLRAGLNNCRDWAREAVRELRLERASLARRAPLTGRERNAGWTLSAPVAGAPRVDW
jgi:hypothetical protein